eukprot:jgi/Mesvir1/3953/Mv09990-RA.3
MKSLRKPQCRGPAVCQLSAMTARRCQLRKTPLVLCTVLVLGVLFSSTSHALTVGDFCTALQKSSCFATPGCDWSASCEPVADNCAGVPPSLDTCQASNGCVINNNGPVAECVQDPAFCQRVGSMDASGCGSVVGTSGQPLCRAIPAYCHRRAYHGAEHLAMMGGAGGSLNPATGSLAEAIAKHMHMGGPGHMQASSFFPSGLGASAAGSGNSPLSGRSVMAGVAGAAHRSHPGADASNGHARRELIVIIDNLYCGPMNRTDCLASGSCNWMSKCTFRYNPCANATNATTCPLSNGCMWMPTGIDGSGICQFMVDRCAAEDSAVNPLSTTNCTSILDKVTNQSLCERAEKCYNTEGTQQTECYIGSTTCCKRNNEFTCLAYTRNATEETCAWSAGCKPTVSAYELCNIMGTQGKCPRELGCQWSGAVEGVSPTCMSVQMENTLCGRADKDSTKCARVNALGASLGLPFPICSFSSSCTPPAKGPEGYSCTYACQKARAFNPCAGLTRSNCSANANCYYMNAYGAEGVESNYGSCQLLQDPCSNNYFDNATCSAAPADSRCVWGKKCPAQTCKETQACKTLWDPCKDAPQANCSADLGCVWFQNNLTVTVGDGKCIAVKELCSSAGGRCSNITDSIGLPYCKAYTACQWCEDTYQCCGLDNKCPAISACKVKPECRPSDIYMCSEVHTATGICPAEFGCTLLEGSCTLSENNPCVALTNDKAGCLAFGSNKGYPGYCVMNEYCLDDPCVGQCCGEKNTTSCNGRRECIWQASCTLKRNPCMYENGSSPTTQQQCEGIVGSNNTALCNWNGFSCGAREEICNGKTSSGDCLAIRDTNGATVCDFNSGCNDCVGGCCGETRDKCLAGKPAEGNCTFAEYCNPVYPDPCRALRNMSACVNNSRGYCSWSGDAANPTNGMCTPSVQVCYRGSMYPGTCSTIKYNFVNGSVPTCRSSSSCYADTGIGQGVNYTCQDVCCVLPREQCNQTLSASGIAINCTWQAEPRCEPISDDCAMAITADTCQAMFVDAPANAPNAGRRCNWTTDATRPNGGFCRRDGNPCASFTTSTNCAASRDAIGPNCIWKQPYCRIADPPKPKNETVDQCVGKCCGEKNTTSCNGRTDCYWQSYCYPLHITCSSGNASAPLTQQQCEGIVGGNGLPLCNWNGASCSVKEEICMGKATASECSSAATKNGSAVCEFGSSCADCVGGCCGQTRDKCLAGKPPNGTCTFTEYCSALYPDPCRALKTPLGCVNNSRGYCSWSGDAANGMCVPLVQVCHKGDVVPGTCSSIKYNFVNASISACRPSSTCSAAVGGGQVVNYTCNDPCCNRTMEQCSLSQNSASGPNPNCTWQAEARCEPISDDCAMATTSERCQAMFVDAAANAPNAGRRCNWTSDATRPNGGFCRRDGNPCANFTTSSNCAASRDAIGPNCIWKQPYCRIADPPKPRNDTVDTCVGKCCGEKNTTSCNGRTDCVWQAYCVPVRNPCMGDNPTIAMTQQQCEGIVGSNGAPFCVWNMGYCQMREELCMGKTTAADCSSVALRNGTAICEFNSGCVDCVGGCCGETRDKCLAGKPTEGTCKFSDYCTTIYPDPCRALRNMSACVNNSRGYCSWSGDAANLTNGMCMPSVEVCYRGSMYPGTCSTIKYNFVNGSVPTCKPLSTCYTAVGGEQEFNITCQDPCCVLTREQCSQVQSASGNCTWQADAHCEPISDDCGFALTADQCQAMFVDAPANAPNAGRRCMWISDAAVPNTGYCKREVNPCANFTTSTTCAASRDAIGPNCIWKQPYCRMNDSTRPKNDSQQPPNDPNRCFDIRAPDACSGKLGCQWYATCQPANNSCSAKASQAQCESSAACYWMPRIGGNATEGFCDFKVQTCSTFRNDERGCNNTAGCAWRAQCSPASSDCNPGAYSDPTRASSYNCKCYSQQDPCDAQPTCTWRNTCQPTSDRCWAARTRASCAALGNCTWEVDPSQPANVSEIMGWCSGPKAAECSLSTTCGSGVGCLSRGECQPCDGCNCASDAIECASADYYGCAWQQKCSPQVDGCSNYNNKRTDCANNNRTCQWSADPKDPSGARGYCYNATSVCYGATPDQCREPARKCRMWESCTPTNSTGGGDYMCEYCTACADALRLIAQTSSMLPPDLLRAAFQSMCMAQPNVTEATCTRITSNITLASLQDAKGLCGLMATGDPGLCQKISCSGGGDGGGTGEDFCDTCSGCMDVMWALALQTRNMTADATRAAFVTMCLSFGETQEKCAALSLNVNQTSLREGAGLCTLASGVTDGRTCAGCHTWEDFCAGCGQCQGDVKAFAARNANLTGDTLKAAFRAFCLSNQGMTDPECDALARNITQTALQDAASLCSIAVGNGTQFEGSSCLSCAGSGPGGYFCDACQVCVYGLREVAAQSAGLSIDALRAAAAVFCMSGQGMSQERCTAVVNNATLDSLRDGTTLCGLALSDGTAATASCAPCLKNDTKDVCYGCLDCVVAVRAFALDNLNLTGDALKAAFRATCGEKDIMSDADCAALSTQVTHASLREAFALCGLGTTGDNTSCSACAEGFGGEYCDDCQMCLLDTRMLAFQNRAATLAALRAAFLTHCYPRYGTQADCTLQAQNVTLAALQDGMGFCGRAVGDENGSCQKCLNWSWDDKGEEGGMCDDCSNCVGRVRGFVARNANLTGDPLKAAFRDFCQRQPGMTADECGALAGRVTMPILEDSTLVCSQAIAGDDYSCKTCGGAYESFCNDCHGCVWDVRAFAQQNRNLTLAALRTAFVAFCVDKGKGTQAECTAISQNVTLAMLQDGVPLCGNMVGRDNGSCIDCVHHKACEMCNDCMPAVQAFAGANAALSGEALRTAFKAFCLEFEGMTDAACTELARNVTLDMLREAKVVCSRAVAMDNITCGECTQRQVCDMCGDCVPAVRAFASSNLDLSGDMLRTLFQAFCLQFEGMSDAACARVTNNITMDSLRDGRVVCSLAVAADDSSCGRCGPYDNATSGGDYCAGCQQCVTDIRAFAQQNRDLSPSALRSAYLGFCYPRYGTQAGCSLQSQNITIGALQDALPLCGNAVGGDPRACVYCADDADVCRGCGDCFTRVRAFAGRNGNLTGEALRAAFRTWCAEQPGMSSDKCSALASVVTVPLLADGVMICSRAVAQDDGSCGKCSNNYYNGTNGASCDSCRGCIMDVRAFANDNRNLTLSALRSAFAAFCAAHNGTQAECAAASGNVTLAALQDAVAVCGNAVGNGPGDCEDCVEYQDRCHSCNECASRLRTFADANAGLSGDALKAAFKAFCLMANGMTDAACTRLSANATMEALRDAAPLCGVVLMGDPTLCRACNGTGVSLGCTKCGACADTMTAFIAERGKTGNFSDFCRVRSANLPASDPRVVMCLEVSTLLAGNRGLIDNLDGLCSTAANVVSCAACAGGDTCRGCSCQKDKPACDRARCEWSSACIPMADPCVAKTTQAACTGNCTWIESAAFGNMCANAINYCYGAAPNLTAPANRTCPAGCQLAEECQEPCTNCRECLGHVAGIVKFAAGLEKASPSASAMNLSQVAYAYCTSLDYVPEEECLQLRKDTSGLSKSLLLAPDRLCARLGDCTPQCLPRNTTDGCPVDDMESCCTITSRELCAANTEGCSWDVPCIVANDVCLSATSQSTCLAKGPVCRWAIERPVGLRCFQAQDPCVGLRHNATLCAATPGCALGAAACKADRCRPVRERWSSANLTALLGAKAPVDGTGANVGNLAGGATAGDVGNNATLLPPSLADFCGCYRGRPECVAAGGGVCEWDSACVLVFDPCDVRSSSRVACLGNPDCAWVERPGNLSSCVSVRDPCAAGHRDAARCLNITAPGTTTRLCNAVPKCMATTCAPWDACCRLGGASAGDCDAVDSDECSWYSSCRLAVDSCQAYGREQCQQLPYCYWRPGWGPVNGTAALPPPTTGMLADGQCMTALNPCRGIEGSPAACRAVRWEGGGDVCVTDEGCTSESWCDPDDECCHARDASSCAVAADGCLWEPRCEYVADICWARVNGGDCGATRGCYWVGDPAGSGRCLPMNDPCRGFQNDMKRCAAYRDARGEAVCRPSGYCGHAFCEDELPSGGDVCCSVRDSDTCASTSLPVGVAPAGSNGKCAWSSRCELLADPCSLFGGGAVNKTQCEGRPGCIWGADGCRATASMCDQRDGDPEGCLRLTGPNGARLCQPVGYCEVDACAADDLCCRAGSKDSCAATSQRLLSAGNTTGCSWDESCQPHFDACWLYGTSALCRVAGCEWRLLNTSNAAAGGYCWDPSNPCLAAGRSVVLCAGVTNAWGDRLCEMSGSCGGQCGDCQKCLANVRGFRPWLASSAGTSVRSLPISSQVEAYCLQLSGGVDANGACKRAGAAVDQDALLIDRPPMMCRALGLCTGSCAAALRLNLCEGYVSPSTVTPSCASARNASTGVNVTTCTCFAQEDCTRAPAAVAAGLSACDSFSAATGGVCQSNCGCDPATGKEACGGCLGRCVSKCAQLFNPAAMDTTSSTIGSRSGRPCANATDASCGAGLTCTPAPCRNCACDEVSATISCTPCFGQCLPALAVMSSARFTSSLGGIDVTLNAAAEDDLVPCAQLFEASTLVALGGNSICKTTGSLLSITLGVRPTVKVNDTLRLRANKLRQRGVADGYFDAATGVRVDAPLLSQPPVAVIIGPKTVGSSCGGNEGATFTLDGGYSVTVGVTSYLWTLSAYPSTAGRTAVDIALGQFDRDPALRLPYTLPAGSYTIKLTVRDSLNVRDTEEFTFVKSASPLPRVTIQGGATRTFGKSAGDRVVVVVDPSTVCDPKSTTTYSWSFLPTSPAQFEIYDASSSANAPAGGLLCQIYARNNALEIPRACNAIRGGATYLLQVTVTVTDSNNVTQTVIVPVTLAVKSSALRAVIAGGSQRNVLASGEILLSSAGSTDPDDPTNAAESLRFSWSCATNLETPCFNNLNLAPSKTDGDVYRIPAGALTPGMYLVTLLVFKGTNTTYRSATTTAILDVIAGAATGTGVPPTGSITRICRTAICPQYPTILDPIRLIVSADQPNVIVRWSCDGLNLPSPGVAKGVDTPILIVYPEFLSSGAVYVFTANLSAAGNPSLSSVVTERVQMHQGPQCQFANASLCFKFDHDEGYALGGDTFVAKVDGWSASSDGGQLKYEFGYYDDSGVFVQLAAGWQESTYIFDQLPAGNASSGFKRRVEMCAVDAMGARECVSGWLTVRVYVVPLKTLVDTFADKLAAALVTQDENSLLRSVLRNTGLLNAINGTDTNGTAAANDTTAALTQKQAIRDALAGALYGAVERAVGSSNLAGMAVGLVEVTVETDEVTPRARTLALEAARSVAGQYAGDDTLRMSDATALNVLGTLDNLLAAFVAPNMSELAGGGSGSLAVVDEYSGESGAATKARFEATLGDLLLALLFGNTDEDDPSVVRAGSIVIYGNVLDSSGLAGGTYTVGGAQSSRRRRLLALGDGKEEVGAIPGLAPSLRGAMERGRVARGGARRVLLADGSLVGITFPATFSDWCVANNSTCPEQVQVTMSHTADTVLLLRSLTSFPANATLVSGQVSVSLKDRLTNLVVDLVDELRLGNYLVRVPVDPDLYVVSGTVTQCMRNANGALTSVTTNYVRGAPTTSVVCASPRLGDFVVVQFPTSVVSPPPPSPPPPPPTNGTSTGGKKDSGGISIGIIAGAAGGAVALIVIIIILLVLKCRHQNTRVEPVIKVQVVSPHAVDNERRW